MFGADAFLLARIANSEPAGSLAGYDLARISPTLRPLAERLIVANHLERWAIWDEFLREVSNAPRRRRQLASQSRWAMAELRR